MLIAQGRVVIDGKAVTEPWYRVDPQRARVEVDGQPVQLGQKLIYVLLNKPAGYLATMADPWRRPTVLELVKGIGGRVYPVGRLDLDTEGAILLTNDGELAYRLTHPKYEVPKVYQVLVEGVPTPGDLERLSKGVEIEEGRTAPAEVKLVKVMDRDALVEMKIYEGRKRQVKRMLWRVGHPVRKLVRLEFAGLRVNGLPVGWWRYLSEEEVEGLKGLVGLREHEAQGVGCRH